MLHVYSNMPTKEYIIVKSKAMTIEWSPALAVQDFKQAENYEKLLKGGQRGNQGSGPLPGKSQVV